MHFSTFFWHFHRVPKFDLDSDVPLQACLVHNAETIRVKFFIDLLVESKFPLMLIGLAGSGKTLMLNEALGHLDEEYLIASVPFNFYYNSELTQKILEKPLEKKVNRSVGVFLGFGCHLLAFIVCLLRPTLIVHFRQERTMVRQAAKS